LAIPADGFSIDPDLSLDLALTYLLVQQCLDRGLQRQFQNVHPLSPICERNQWELARSVAVCSDVYREICAAKWGILKWPQVGDFGWPSGDSSTWGGNHPELFRTWFKARS
jgi:hypothetical protein